MEESNLIIRELFINFCILMTLTTFAALLQGDQPPRRGVVGSLRLVAIYSVCGLIILKFPVQLPGDALLAFHPVAPAIAPKVRSTSPSRAG